MRNRAISRWMGVVVGGLALTQSACTDDPPLRPDQKILAVPESKAWIFPELSRPVYVVRTEANVPHIYASNRLDLAFVQGFVMGRDRYFMLELSRGLGTGTLSSLLGDAALETDLESRGTGMAYITDQIEKGFTPELAAYADAFASGINAYVDLVKADKMQGPSELQLAFGLLGAPSARSLMSHFDRRSVAAMITVVMYNSSYETGDIGRAATAAQLPTLFEGATDQALRRQGAIRDLWQALSPTRPFASAPGLGTFVGYDGEAGTAASVQRETQSAANTQQDGTVGMGKTVSSELLARAVRRNKRIQIKLNRNRDVGYGSNAWAVTGSASTSGAGLMAGDGHLSMSVPSILYNMGLDTEVFGRGNTHQLGMTVPGFPVVAIGTNGRVAWSQTQLSGDITDWYREEIQLDVNGLPAQALFKGEWKDLVRTDEVYEVRSVPALGSEGRTETWSLWQTFDGRWIGDVEGRSASPDEVLADGEALVNMRGDWVVPADMDDDGVITAISFDYAGFEAGGLFAAADQLGHAKDVFDFREKTKGLVGYSQNFAVADLHGNIMYTAYQTVPCRAHLERDGDRNWLPGSDPELLLDGTKYGSFEIPIRDGVVDEEPGKTDPSKCVVPFEATPMSINPTVGHVVTANNDPGGMTFDNSVTNDDWYIGGPYASSFRAETIANALEKTIAEGTADVAKMAEIQGDHSSPLGRFLLGHMLESIDYARGLSSPTEEADQRAAAMYAADKGAIEEVQKRLQTWADRGYLSESGVETFYNPEPSTEQRENAAATMIFNAWMSRVLAKTFNDEGLPGVWRPSGDHGRVRALDQFLRSRGTNALGMASFNTATGESVFFDKLDTPEVESSHEIIIEALVDALVFLRSAPEGVDGEDPEPGTGGFDTDDMSQWLWGMRHYAKFESLLEDFLGDASAFSAITQGFSVTTGVVPLAVPPPPPGDPRFGLKWFPRPGDQWAVDAANPGTSGVRFSHGSGPVMRMVVALREGEVWGVNIIPGGQSALTDSPHFADQARLWLGNDTLPLRFSVDQVVAGASGRESFNPQ
jgi:acyl-homoserine lactone acylase PvdQ